MKITEGRASYHQTDMGLAVAVRFDTSPVITRTRALPMRYEAIVDVGDGTARVELIVTAFGDEAAGTFRAGVRTFTVVEYVGGDGSAPLPADLLKRISVYELLLDALRLWSLNSDSSEVSAGQVKALTRGSTARPADREERWRRAATAYVEAQRAGAPTTAAVVAELGLRNDANGQAAARQMIQRLKRKGLLDEARSEMEGNR